MLPHFRTDIFQPHHVIVRVRYSARNQLAEGYPCARIVALALDHDPHVFHYVVEVLESASRDEFWHAWSTCGSVEEVLRGRRRRQMCGKLRQYVICRCWHGGDAGRGGENA